MVKIEHSDLSVSYEIVTNYYYHCPYELKVYIGLKHVYSLFALDEEQTKWGDPIGKVYAFDANGAVIMSIANRGYYGEMPK